MDHGELLTYWSARVALLAYAAALAAMIGGSGIANTDVSWQAPRQRAARALWTFGCLMYLAHVALAFHFFHKWSHEAAYEHTAQTVEAWIGWRWGGGLWFNYAFTAVWLADVAWWWLHPAGYYHRTWWLTAGIHTFVMFMAINATVVFAAGPTRWTAVAVLAILLGLALSRLFALRT